MQMAFLSFSRTPFILSYAASSLIYPNTNPVFLFTYLINRRAQD